MTRRKGELTIERIQRSWPHSVVVPREVFDCGVPLAAAYPTMAPRNGSICYRGKDFVRAYFRDLDEAELFRRRAGGWAWTDSPTADRPSTVWPPR
jgi:hypothetical protein